VIVSAVLLANLSGCGFTILKSVYNHIKDSSDSSSSSSSASTAIKWSKDFSFTGRVVKITNEKGYFWGIVGDDGNQYDPSVSLDSAYQLDGRRVKVKAKLATNAVSSHSWGRVIKIRRIKPLKE
jgi:hypothetical protein